MCDYCNKGFEIDFIGYREEKSPKCSRCESMGMYVITQSYPKVHVCYACAQEYHRRHEEMLDKFLVSDPKMDKDGEI